MEKHTIEKSTAEVYKIRFESGLYWANITIDDLGQQGRIQIASDFGNWQFFWSSCGCPFKEFLCQLNIGYVAGKFREADYFDHTATIEKFKRDVLEQRRSDYICAEEARDFWTEIQGLEEHVHIEAFKVAVWDSKIYYFYHGMPEIQTKISPRFRRFWDTVWPRFTDELRREMKKTELESIL